MSTDSTAKNQILFLDIDGPMIPYRAVYLPNQTRVMTIFDPIAVAMINSLCKKRGLKIVIHSTWINVIGQEETLKHCVEQGIDKEYFHEDPYCSDKINWRYSRIAEWLERHPEVSKYVIVDDTPYEDDLYGAYKHPAEMNSRLVLINYNDGITMGKLTEIVDIIDEF